MTDYPRAKLANVTQADPSQPVLLSLQFEAGQDRVTDISADGSRYERVEINMHQLRNIVADGAKMLKVAE